MEAYWCCLMNACPTSSTAKVLERWVQVLMVVVEGRGRTTTAQGHVEGTVEWVEGSEVVATGLVPGFAGYPSSTTVESEQIVGVVVVEGRTHLSDDKDAVEDAGSGREHPKGWCRDGWWCWWHYQRPVEGVCVRWSVVETSSRRWMRSR